MPTPNSSKVIALVLVVYIERAKYVGLRETIGINATASLELESVLIILDTELRLYNFVNKEIQAALEIGGSDIRVVA